MSTTRAPAPPPSMAGRSWSRRLGGALNGWWIARRARRLENLAIPRLRAMSERELKDIGIVRSQIEFAARGDRERHCAYSRHF